MSTQHRLRSNSNWSSLKWKYHSTHIMTPHRVCVSLVMVRGIMSPVSCVTQISFYRSTLSGRNTHTHLYTHTHVSYTYPTVLLCFSLTAFSLTHSPHTPPSLSFYLSLILSLSLFPSQYVSVFFTWKGWKERESLSFSVLPVLASHTCHFGLTWL